VTSYPGDVISRFDCSIFIAIFKYFNTKNIYIPFFRNWIKIAVYRNHLVWAVSAMRLIYWILIFYEPDFRSWGLYVDAAYLLNITFLRTSFYSWGLYADLAYLLNITFLRTRFQFWGLYAERGLSANYCFFKNQFSHLRLIRLCGLFAEYYFSKNRFSQLRLIRWCGLSNRKNIKRISDKKVNMSVKRWSTRRKTSFSKRKNLWILLIFLASGRKCMERNESIRKEITTQNINAGIRTITLYKRRE